LFLGYAALVESGAAVVRLRERTAAFMAAMERAVAHLVDIMGAPGNSPTRPANGAAVRRERGRWVMTGNGQLKSDNGVEKTHPYITGYREKTVVAGKRRAIPENIVEQGVRSRGELDLPPPVLTVQDLAVLLATSCSGVYSRVARGQVPGRLRIGRTLRFDPRVIARWLSANKASAGGLP